MATKVLIDANERELRKKLDALVHIDPAISGGIKEIVLDHRAIGRDEAIPSFWERGTEEIHLVAPGFCVHLVDAYIDQDWRISASSAERNLRLRIALEGEADYTTSKGRVSDESTQCAFIIRPAGDLLTGAFGGGKHYRYCSLNMTSDFLTRTLALGSEELPGMLVWHWERNDTATGNFPLSRTTLAQARRLLVTQSAQAWRDVEIHANALHLLRLVFEDWRKAKGGTRTSTFLSQEDRDKLERVRRLMEGNLAKSFTIAALCSRFRLNRNKLHYGFKQMFGVSAHEFQVECRMRTAMQLLTSTALSVSEIADRVGYSEPTNFTAAFKKHFAILPKQIRTNA